MNINVGSSTTRLPGFLNVDIRRVEGVDIVGHAGAFRGVADGTVQTLFASAVLEHIFLGQHLAVLAEWKRVLAPDGLIVCIAIPDFAMLARLYLQNAPGVINERFDLLNVYRYTHGWPEEALAPVWAQWQPDKSSPMRLQRNGYRNCTRRFSMSRMSVVCWQPADCRVCASITSMPGITKLTL